MPWFRVEDCRVFIPDPVLEYLEYGYAFLYLMMRVRHKEIIVKRAVFTNDENTVILPKKKGEEIITIEMPKRHLAEVLYDMFKEKVLKVQP